MAEDARLTPAIINQMALLAASTAMTNAESVETLCEKSWRHRLSAARETFALRTGCATSYHLEFTNTSPSIGGIGDALARTGKGKLLLYGPPGTGKTELAHHVSRHLNRPLMSKRASDLMSSWVGETEKNMARMFREAAADGAVLLLDEADGFLQDRGQALRNWEVTEVNELMTQMEQFNGVFICTTNLIDRIDQAAFRRFGLKVRFDYLSTEQRWATFLHFFGSSVSGLDAASTATLRKRIESMDRLTPGDFSAVQAQQEIRGNMAASDIVEAIAEEYRLKPGSAKNAIGFLT
jgi:SpoVK/Ycf46/Vps4 family AAA+-type ATPase